MLRGDPAPDRHLIELNKESKNNRNNILKTLFPSLLFAPVPIRIKSKGLPRPSSKYVFQYGFFHSSLKPLSLLIIVQHCLGISFRSQPLRFPVASASTLSCPTALSSTRCCVTLSIFSFLLNRVTSRVSSLSFLSFFAQKKTSSSLAWTSSPVSMLLLLRRTQRCVVARSQGPSLGSTPSQFRLIV